MLGHLRIPFLWPTTPLMNSQIRYRLHLTRLVPGNRILEDYSGDSQAQSAQLSNPLSILLVESLVEHHLLALKEGQMQQPLSRMVVGTGEQTQQPTENRMPERTRERMQEAPLGQEQQILEVVLGDLSVGLLAV